MKTRWNDEYWLLLMQIYIKKPAGVKPLYSRDMVNLALELHLSPQYLYRKMFSLRRLETPRLEHLWNTYAKSPGKLAKGVKLLRRMYGFNNADLFYDGVEVNESFEMDFRPLPECSQLTPVMLILILDLYFRLTPNTMVPSTPEIIKMAKKMRVTPQLIVDVMTIYQYCDPYLRKKDGGESPLTKPCKAIWQRYGNDDPSQLASYAAQLIEYFK